ncbi:hypothetical protein EMCRGX_G008751 [Ephydatia muelleri]
MTISHTLLTKHSDARSLDARNMGSESSKEGDNGSSGSSKRTDSLSGATIVVIGVIVIVCVVAIIGLAGGFDIGVHRAIEGKVSDIGVHSAIEGKGKVSDIGVHSAIEGKVSDIGVHSAIEGKGKVMRANVGVVASILVNAGLCSLVNPQRWAQRGVIRNQTFCSLNYSSCVDPQIRLS